VVVEECHRRQQVGHQVVVEVFRANRVALQVVAVGQRKRTEDHQEAVAESPPYLHEGSAVLQAEEEERRPSLAHQVVVVGRHHTSRIQLVKVVQVVMEGIHGHEQVDDVEAEGLLVPNLKEVVVGLQ